MHDVVAAGMTQQVPEDSEPEPQRRPHPSPPGAGVEVTAWRHVDDSERGARPFVMPLPPRQVGDLVDEVQPFGEVSVPALGPAHGVGKEAVVDDRNAHGMAQEPNPAYRSPD